MARWRSAATTTTIKTVADKNMAFPGCSRYGYSVTYHWGFSPPKIVIKASIRKKITRIVSMARRWVRSSSKEVRLIQSNLKICKLTKLPTMPIQPTTAKATPSIQYLKVTQFESLFLFFLLLE